MSLAQNAIAGSQALNGADAATALGSIQTLCVTIKAAVMTIVQSQGALTQTGTSGVVAQSIQTQVTLAGTISQGVLALLPADQAGAAQQSLNGMTGALNIAFASLTKETSSTVIIADQGTQAVSPQACAAIGFVPASQADQAVSPQQCQALGLVQTNQTVAPPPDVAQNSTLLAAQAPPPQPAASKRAAGAGKQGASKQNAPPPAQAATQQNSTQAQQAAAQQAAQQQAQLQACAAIGFVAAANQTAQAPSPSSAKAKKGKKRRGLVRF